MVTHAAADTVVPKSATCDLSPTLSVFGVHLSTKKFSGTHRPPVAALAPSLSPPIARSQRERRSVEIDRRSRDRTRIVFLLLRNTFGRATEFAATACGARQNPIQVSNDAIGMRSDCTTARTPGLH